MASRLTRRIVVGGAAVLAVLVGLQVVNYLRLDLGALGTNAEPILAEAHALTEKAKPEYQELALATLPPNLLNGPYHRLDDMLDRAVVKQEPPPVAVDGAVVAAFEFDDPAAPSLKAAQGALSPSVRGGLLEVVSDSDDYLENAVELAVPREEIGDLVIRMKADKGTYLRLAWTNAQGPVDGKIWRAKFDVRFNDNKDFHTYVINARDVMRRGLRKGENLARLYIRPADIAGAKIDIDYIRFISKASRYTAASHAVDYESIAGEMRRAIYMRPDQKLEFALAVPAQAPRLDLGMGVLLDGRPLRFEVGLTQADGAVVPLHDEAIADTERWREARIDLARWAGQEVRLSLRSTGDQGNVAFWANPIVSSAPEKPFNVIFMIEDAERADYLSVYGHPTKTTPFKERLMAERGVLFERAITQAEKTRPSAASYITGLYPTTTGLWYFADVLSDRYLTWAEIMRAQGYLTVAFTQNGNVGPFAGMHQGFDRMVDASAVGSTTEGVFTGDRVMQFLEQNRDRNFFLYLHAIDPHAAYDPPQPFRDQFLSGASAGGTPVPRDPVFDAPWVERPTVETRRRLYEAEIAHNDAVTEDFFGRLDRMGLSNDTLVIMASDHGEYLGDHSFFGNQLWDHRPPTYLAGTHVPMMFVYPKRFPEPKRIQEPVQMLDLLPTVLDLAGVDRTDLLLQGRSLLGLIDGQQPDNWRDRVVVTEEPTAMLKSDPCACGSLHFRDWHLLSSSWMWPRDALYAPTLQAFLTTSVLAVDGSRGESQAWSFLPDLMVRLRQRAILTELREANMATWRKLTEGEGDERVIDPDTLERLRGLGYVN
jgi:arylsulfatase A-like enzyme